MRHTLVVGIALLLVAAAGGLLYFKDTMLGRFLIIAATPGPDHAFNAGHAEAALDYSQLSSWLAHPETENNADWRPAGSPQASHGAPSAYVFFIHPTAYLGSEHWIGTLDKNTATEENRQWTLVNQASAYNRCCVVYAPYYRELSITAYFENDLSVTSRAIDFAYQDVARAFQSFLQEIPANSPFIIASHSQGSLHGQRLLQQVIDPSQLRQRLVAAYLLGGTIHEHLFSSHYKNIGICGEATDIHCAIAFDTWREGAEPISSVPNWVGDRYTRNGHRWLCVNPLSWAHNEEAVAASNNPGSMPILNGYNLYFPSSDLPQGLEWGPLGIPIKGLASAQCAGGVLRSNDIEPGPFDGLSWGGNYHSLDYALYYLSISTNASARVAAWRRQYPAGIALQLPSKG